MPLKCSRQEHAMAQEWDGPGIIVPACRRRGRKVLWIHTSGITDPFPEGWSRILLSSVVPGKPSITLEGGEKKEIAWED